VSHDCGIAECIALSTLIGEAMRLAARGAKLKVDGDLPMHRIARVSTVLALLPFAAAMGLANAQAVETKAVSSSLSALDYNFVAQANLGAPFQVDSGRLAEKKAGTAAIRNYAHLMVVTHIPVVDALNTILQHKGIAAPANTLLHGAYAAMIATLKADRGTAFDRDYLDGQVDYQKGNAALFQDEIKNGNDPELKEFARQTLPKIEDHLARAVRLAGRRSGQAARTNNPGRLSSSPAVANCRRLRRTMTAPSSTQYRDRTIRAFTRVGGGWANIPPEHIARTLPASVPISTAVAMVAIASTSANWTVCTSSKAPT
jgi:putative membrane protein